ncbi:MAG: DUF2147 domain-containing protein [Hyphomicrobiaceae bacterium]
MIEYPYPTRRRVVAHRILAWACVASVLVLGSAVAQQAPRGIAPSAPPAPAPGAPGAPAPPSGPVGVWIDHTGRGAVEISSCGVGLCGRIIWMKQPFDKSGHPLLDQLNENRRLRGRPICGLQIIGDLKPMRDGSWDQGWIYDPEQGERFDVELRLREPNVLQVTGYKGLKFLSETYRWRRAAELPAPACAPTSNPA